MKLQITVSPRLILFALQVTTTSDMTMKDVFFRMTHTTDYLRNFLYPANDQEKFATTTGGCRNCTCESCSEGFVLHCVVGGNKHVHQFFFLAVLQVE